ncbi:MAG: glycerophosphodiester phosphodiesterase [Deltaproteobacteria bacterium]|jgi:glycerophosphoryl diester phosphodiesterase|nr:glycerophosphodiester phosphodiesterase [Deltaproteobacteria bacterium]MBW2382856.1 glycerophosphodiester phosphodiesterase [Deltaproteobacteria bacterium]MBW2698876.1 glycerophosphodiester phosphodiesterase [Deltaproteobacteria bacterium]
MLHPYFDVTRPVILGHRGAAGVAPENTLAAFARGLADGAHIIESDVQRTKDGVPVLIHDAELDRTTDGHGPVASLTWAELQELDAGHWFTAADTGDFPFRGRGHRVPSLKQTFEAWPEARFNLELKAESREMVAEVVRLVQKLDRENRTLLTAGEDRVQAMLREELEESGARPALGASLADILAVVQSALAGAVPSTDSMALQIPTEFAGNPLVTPELVAHCHAHGIEVHVWTVNDPDEIRRLIALGVDGIVTDYPGRMAQLCAERDA